jgi:hypothetical protein
MECFTTLATCAVSQARLYCEQALLIIAPKQQYLNISELSARRFVRCHEVTPMGSSLPADLGCCN